MKKTKHLLLALTFILGTGAMSQAEPKPTAAQKLKADQELDKIAGLLTNDWIINKININSHVQLPPKLQAGPPPYRQQPEQAQKTMTTGSYTPTVIIKP